MQNVLDFSSASLVTDEGKPPPDGRTIRSHSQLNVAFETDGSPPTISLQVSSEV